MSNETPTASKAADAQRQKALINATELQILSLNTYIDGKNVTLLTAIHLGALVGVVELMYYKRRVAAIRRLYVHQQFRMQGIGRSLVDKCCEIAKVQGQGKCTGLSLLVDLKNVDAFCFYTRLGFICAYQDDEDWILTRPFEK